MNTPISLKVTEALSRDVGKGLARLDPQDLRKLNASPGDIVKIQGKRETVAKLMLSYQDARGQEGIQIDGLTRQNIRAGIGEKVTVEVISAHPATQVILSPVGGKGAFYDKGNTSYVGKLINDLPLISGDIIRATLFGSRFQDFTVLGTKPTGVVIINPKTQIKVESSSTSESGKTRISYEDLGGMDRAIERIREMVELPLKYPQVFEKLGIDPPKGVLLHGPPGCGKTLLARAVASETDVAFFSVSGPEIIDKFYGQSEAKLRDIFEQAKKKAPAIIFLDEIDSIAPKREKVVGDVEKRVVAQLLALMDGMSDRGSVMIIGATNLPNQLDPALRRPGRFDREIFIGIPDARGRRDIVEIYTRGMPLAENVDLEKIAAVTHGFTGADLAALSREAAMASLRRVIPNLDFDRNSIPSEVFSDLVVTMEDFLAALKEVEPSAIREVFVEIPDVSWNDVGGLEDVRRDLIEAIEWPLKFRNLFLHAKLRPTKGILLSGPPGCGKTLLAKALAKELDLNFISIKGPELMSMYVGESERGIQEIFKKARHAAPCILFFDEFDALVPTRGVDSGSSRVSERVVSQFLTELDGIQVLKEVWILAATNRRDMIDPALLRPGRFDLLLELPLPDEKTREQILQVHNRGKQLSPDVDLQAVAKETPGTSGAEMEAISREASLTAVREFIAGVSQDLLDRDASFHSFLISNEHFQTAKKKVLARLS